MWTPHPCAPLEALVLTPRVKLMRFHGAFALGRQHRALVAPAKQGKGNPGMGSDEPQTPAEWRAFMSWVQRLGCVFSIDNEAQGRCRQQGNDAVRPPV